VNALLARFGIVRLLRLERAYLAGLPLREYAEMRALLARPRTWSVGADGLDAWRERSRHQVNAARRLGSLPLVVLGVTEQDRYPEVLTRLQAELATLSSNTRQVVAAGATHYTLVSDERYARIVSEAIGLVTTSARTGEPSPP
jgi:hypothetical protein